MALSLSPLGTTLLLEMYWIICSLAIVLEGILAEHGGVAHVDVKGARDDGQGSDAKRSHLFCQDLRQTCE